MEIRAAAIRVWPPLAFRPTLTYPAWGLAPPTGLDPKGAHDRYVPEDRIGSGGCHQRLPPAPGANHPRGLQPPIAWGALGLTLAAAIGGVCGSLLKNPG